LHETKETKVELPTTCSDCGGAMSAGFLVDQGYGMEKVSTWQEGEPQKKWWAMGGITQSGATRIEVTTLRCDRCGILKSYAV
jgi:hypothetical protein